MFQIVFHSMQIIQSNFYFIRVWQDSGTGHTLSNGLFDAFCALQKPGIGVGLKLECLSFLISSSFSSCDKHIAWKSTESYNHSVLGHIFREHYHQRKPTAGKKFFWYADMHTETYLTAFFFQIILICFPFIATSQQFDTNKENEHNIWKCTFDFVRRCVLSAGLALDFSSNFMEN